MDHNTLTPDVETSSDDYRRRFRGAIGQYLLQVQADGVFRLLHGGRRGPLSVLEVGGGHAQLTPDLLERGYDVCVHGSDPSCRRQIEPLMERFPERLDFVTSSLWSLPFADRSFDLVMAIRVLPHVERWEALLAEMTRVSRRYVLVDYTSLFSVNLLGRAFFQIKRTVEGNTRPYFCHTARQLGSRLRRLGLDRISVYREFLLPVGLHRMVGRASLSAAIERACRLVGLTRLFGSPALLVAERSPRHGGVG